MYLHDTGSGNGTITGSNNASGITNSPTSAPIKYSPAPTTTPIITPWHPGWNWLSGYSGRLYKTYHEYIL